jgi:purine-binding chemotaxis protein CheW
MEEFEEDTQKGRFLTFLIGKEMYGIEIRFVTEIIGIQAITGMPEMPDYVKGIINLRGKIIPVMDVRLRFRKQPREYDDRTCVIVIDFNGVSIGLIVDSVSEVLTIPEQDIAELPSINTNLNNGYVKNIGKVGANVILLIDCEKLISSDELDAFNAEALNAVL